MDSARFLDLIRLGTYAQLEGTFTLSGNRNNYRFRFDTNQIKDIKPLITRLTGKKDFGGLAISISSKELYDEIHSLGFNKFYSHNWNIPNLNNFGETGRKEYIRAVIDSIGNIDVEDSSPIIQLSSVNEISSRKIGEIFDGSVRGPYDNRVFVRWRGTKALYLLDYLEWEFNNFRNERGASLVQSVRWTDYLI